MNRLRWWLFKALSHVGWRICPEPQRSRLMSVMPIWSGDQRGVVYPILDGRAPSGEKG